MTISDVSLIALCINVLCLFRLLKVKPELKWFGAYLVWALVIQIIAPYYGRYFGNNLPLLHLYTIFEFVFLSLFYEKILIRKLEYGKYFPWFVVLIVLLLIGNTFFLQPLTTFNSNAKGLAQIIIMSYTIIYFFNRISVDVSEGNIFLNRVNAAILLYYAGSLFIFTFAQFLLESPSDINRLFWMFNAALYLVFQLLILLTTCKVIFSHKE